MSERSVRRIVLSSELSDDISDIEENFNERDAREEAGEVFEANDLMSSFDSQASRQNFWKELHQTQG